ncbi:MAG: MFS transporter [Alphaproteobacteria bacterium]|nr:MFS transporter [Alphaproteobacteria bacterium]MBL7099424.1 MFS transporter [Alphaproteobacteria bacterium]
MTNRHYILVMVTLVFVVNYLDRQILGILLPLIQKEFRVSDTQLGILTGPAFALIYASLGMPFAVIADRANRRNIIALSLAIFSAMTVVCNFVTGFWQLVAARAVVGIGEAGTGPSINSIIADLYPPQQRASALAFYSAGLNVGLLIAFFGGGIIAGTFGWRAAFLASGIPGLILVFLFLFTVPEPPRGHSEALIDTGGAPGFMATVRYLWGQRSFRFLSLGTSMSAFSGYAGLAFVPSFLARTHHLTPTQIGLLLAITTGVFGYIGTLLSGVIADRVGKKDIRRTMLVPVVATLIGLPFAPFFYLSSSLTVVIASLAVPAFLGASYLGPAYAATQGLVPLRMRATAAAVLLFILNIVGLSFGPLWVGVVSDALKPSLGPDSLRWALLSNVVFTAAGALLYWLSSRTLDRDMARVSGEISQSATQPT